jgi:hypothetical protein
MLQAVRTVRVAMNDFYGSLTDEQKAAFDVIGPQRTAASGQPYGGRRYIRGGHTSIEQMIRRMISSAR